MSLKYFKLQQNFIDRKKFRITKTNSLLSPRALNWHFAKDIQNKPYSQILQRYHFWGWHPSGECINVTSIETKRSMIFKFLKTNEFFRNFEMTHPSLLEERTFERGAWMTPSFSLGEPMTNAQYLWLVALHASFQACTSRKRALTEKKICS